MHNIFRSILLLIIISALPFFSMAQVTSPSAVSDGSRMGVDYFIFCASGAGSANGRLEAQSPFDANSSFTWEVYNRTIGNYELILQQTDTETSQINNLSDGLYRVLIESDGMSTQYETWVLNNWIHITNAEIPDSTSTCDGFYIEADYEYAPLEVFNPSTGQEFSVRNPNIDFEVRWTHNRELVRSAISPYIYPPIASNTPVRYDLSVEDEFGCIAESYVNYDSKVTEALFVADPLSGEAVLEVNFTNNSVNYDSVYWFFYKDNYVISYEIEQTGEAVDSIDFVLTEDSPMHRYEMSGDYRVRLVTVKINETGNCYDTLYGEFIQVEELFLKIPNVFTPNGDGLNDYFVVESKSLRSLNVKIYNRWGGLVHSWNYSNITTSDYTTEHSIWDGKIGNRMASPGVYYYVIQYEARDIDREDRRQRPKRGTHSGFVHLFREK